MTASFQGLRVESTRKQLLTKKNLTFAKVLEIAQNLETATKDAQQLKREAFGAVYTVTPPKSGNGKLKRHVTAVVRPTTRQVSAHIKTSVNR